MNVKVKDRAKISGSIVIRKYRAGTKELIYESPRHSNRIVSGAGGYGRNLVLRQLSGDVTYGIQIDAGAIGTGNTAPTDADTALETQVLGSIAVAQYAISGDDLVVSFFITDAQLANGTYKEFGMFIGARLFGRVIINPNFVKGSNEDTTIEYTLTLGL